MKNNSSSREGNVLWIFHFWVSTPCGKVHNNDKEATQKEQFLVFLFCIQNAIYN